MPLTWHAAEQPEGDAGSWKGRRKVQADEFLASDEVRRVVAPRLGGPTELQRRATVLNDVLAAHPTPWKSLVWQRGKPARELLAKLKAITDEWNVKDKFLGLTWGVVTVGVDAYSSVCAGLLQVHQPQFWVTVDYLSDRLLAENRAYDRRAELKKKAEEEERLRLVSRTVELLPTISEGSIVVESTFSEANLA
jgi:hypothetical protein